MEAKDVSGTRSATDGTLGFCESCPASGNGCSRVRHGGGVEAPVLLGKEARRIARRTNQEARRFSRNLGDGVCRQIRSTVGCAFFANGQCEIYEDRPIDCRLFPVDIREERDGTLVSIVYTRLCPAGFDRTGLLEHAERLLPALQGHAREYARMDTRGMDAEPFDVLGVCAAETVRQL